MGKFIEVDIDGLAGMAALAEAWKVAPAVVREELEAATIEADLLLEREVKDATPTVTGLLRGSIIGTETVSDSSVIGVISTSISYAIPVELGTRPHLIVAKNGGALSFMFQGKRITVKSVKHPGSKGAFMFSGTLDRHKDHVNKIFAQARDRIATRMTRAAPGAGA